MWHGQLWKVLAGLVDRERLGVHEVWMVAIMETLNDFTMRASMCVTSNEDI